MGLPLKLPHRRGPWLTGWAAILLAVLFMAAAACRRSDPGRSITPPETAPPKPEAPPPPPRGRQISLIYSSNLLGDYEPCGCPVHPMGGIARRATQIDRARAESDAVLVLDAGDLFLPALDRLQGKSPPAPTEIERRARLLASAYARMGITALLPGERDLALGLSLLRRLAAEHRLPLVASNLYGQDGARLFAADRIVEAAGIKVGLFGVVAAPAAEDADAWRRAGIEARDPAAAARESIVDLRSRGAELVIALLHLGRASEQRRLLEAVRGIDWAVLGHSGMRLEMPEKVGGAHMLEAMSDGKELGRLDLHVVGGSLAFTDRGQRAELETILADHRRQLVDHDRRLGDTDPAAMRDYYENRKREIEKAIAREEALLARLPAAITGSWFENRILPLDAATPDHQGVGLLVAAYNAESVRRAAAGKPVGLGTEPRPPGVPPPADDPPTGAAPAGPPPRYLGAAACAGCHPAAFAFWKTTKHARALATLAGARRDRDPACVGCHVTGYLAPGGAQDMTTARGRLANVGCEACHGPGGAHADAAAALATRRATGGPAPGAITRRTPESVCRGCHTPDQTDGEFDHRVFLRAITGPGHGGAL